jgi:hypothetical protein
MNGTVQNSRRLRIVESDQPAATVARGQEQGPPRRARAGRPGDRREPWRLTVTNGLQEVRADAKEAQLELSLSVSLVVERRLILRDLARVGASGNEQLLDKAAREVVPATQLAPTSSAYLRSLNVGSDRLREEGDEVAIVSLPLRLVDRIREVWPPRPILRKGELTGALSWEVAAVLRGLTMSEWAFLVALEGSVA